MKKARQILATLMLRLSFKIIDNFSNGVKHKDMKEAADRGFIKDYVCSCLPYIMPNPEILEFDGGIVYSDLIIKDCGGKVFFATKKGRENRCNKIDFEFDLESEIIDKRFDVIIATQVLGSFFDVCAIIERLKKMLKKNGVLIITISGPAYPKIKGLVSFFSSEGLVKMCARFFGRNNIYNVKSYGDIYSAICMMLYVKNSVFDRMHPKRIMYKHEVICGVLCINKDLQ